MQMMCDVMEITDHAEGPLVVQDLCGTGKAGTYIAIDHAFHSCDDRQHVDIAKIVKNLRQDRAGLVMSPTEYMFIHKVVTMYSLELSAGKLLAWFLSTFYFLLYLSRLRARSLPSFPPHSLHQCGRMCWWHFHKIFFCGFNMRGWLCSLASSLLHLCILSFISNNIHASAQEGGHAQAPPGYQQAPRN
jgi:hypothetical protein